MATKLNPNAIIDNSVDGTKLKDASVTPSKLAPSVMQHLEAITIYTDNTAEHKAANLANIKAYEDNLKAMGVDVTKGYIIPVVSTIDLSNSILIVTNSTYNGFYTKGSYWGCFKVNTTGALNFYEGLMVRGSYSTLATTAKQIIPAINEVNGKIGDIDTILDNIIG